MNPTPENDEQSAFEAWLSSTEPSGDAESVRRQWEQSHEYRALFESEKNDTPLTDAFDEALYSQKGRYGPHTKYWKMLDFARELERDRKRLRSFVVRVSTKLVTNAMLDDGYKLALESAALDAKLSKETT